MRERRADYSQSFLGTRAGVTIFSKLEELLEQLRTLESHFKEGSISVEEFVDEVMSDDNESVLDRLLRSNLYDKSYLLDQIRLTKHRFREALEAVFEANEIN